MQDNGASTGGPGSSAVGTGAEQVVSAHAGDDPSRVIKTASVGVQLLRRSDVRGVISKLISHSKTNIEVALSEDRLDDAEVQQIRRRAFNLVLDGIFDLPVFINAQAIEAGTAKTGTGLVHESAVLAEDASNPSHPGTHNEG